MRANTSRAAALDFGKLVDHYDAGRAAYGTGFVHATARRLGIAAQARQMEVGAGTGQLTTALLAAGGEVVAVEPSAPMAERLRHNCAADVAAGRLRICGQRFETLQPADFGSFDQLWSGDAWHWIDPLAGFRLAAGLLRPGGFLVCRWRFPVLADPDLQRRLNRLYSRLSPDLVRDPETHIWEMEPLLAQGRQEVDDSGYMTVISHWTESACDDIAVSAYVDLQLSYACIGRLTPGQRTELAEGIRDVLGRPGGAAKVSLATWQYTCASQPVTR